MPTTEPLVDTRFAKRLALVNGLIPAALLVWDAWRHQLGVNEVNFAIRTTGLLGLSLLLLSLVITPLRALTGWNRLVAIRRNLGLLAFAYLVAHLAIFVLLDRAGSLASTFHEIVMRRYLWFGTAALALMTPLALTSTDATMRRLGAKPWKRLHRLAYPAAVAAVVHYYLLVKSDTRQPTAFAGALAVLLLYRLVAHYTALRAAARAARPRPAAATPAVERKFWSGELIIARIFDETHYVRTYRFVPVEGRALPFTPVPGQYLTVALTIGGKRVNRSYTIASPWTRGAYCEISVKRVGSGYASRHLHETWLEGHRVRVSAPAGRFVFTGEEHDRVVMIAGGIGITPMMSVLRSLTDRGWHGAIYLLFSVRQVRDIVFRDELAYLEARFSNLHMRVTVTQDPGAAWNGPRGQITRDTIAAFIPGLNRGPVLLCGPTPMMTAMREILTGMGVPDAEILQEVFLSSPQIEEAAGTDLADTTDTPVDGPTAHIVFKRAGATADVPWDRTVLEAAEDAGVEIPFECRSGICGQCKTPLLSGRVRMEVQDALTTVDRAKGLILACQARPLQSLEVDA